MEGYEEVHAREREEQRREKRAEAIKNSIITAIVFVFIIGLAFGGPAFWRYQRVRNAAIQIVVNNLKIQQTEQLVQVENQKAAIRVAEANGIAAAQRIINATLTDRYLQHEAIQAQMQMAGSPNHTQIYIPVGTNGIPLIRTVNPSNEVTPEKEQE